MKRKTGTREWSSHSYNCVSGCSHNCRYCYARASAIRFGRIQNQKQWGTENVRWKDVKKKHPKYDGVVMFPTSHDITPGNLSACTEALGNLLEGGNQILVVSKPHRECIAHLCEVLERFKHQIEFRFTIGSQDNADLAFWEPGAPDFTERLGSLIYAHGRGWKTSVSAEPLLSPWYVRSLWTRLIEFVSETFWIGKLNRSAQRCQLGDDDRQRLARLLAWQDDAHVKAIYDEFRKEPKVRWKDSYREVIDRMV